jgi:diphosphoinositol-polyphosphate diphosphatase
LTRRCRLITVADEFDGFKVLLVTSSRRPEKWIVPGGGVEPEEEPSVTATREVLEEAGVIGKLGRSLGVFEVSERDRRSVIMIERVVCRIWNTRTELKSMS